MRKIQSKKLAGFNGQVWEFQVGPFTLRARNCPHVRAHNRASCAEDLGYWVIGCNGKFIDTALNAEGAKRKLYRYANRVDLLERRLLDLGA